jgi:hypothetical protein
MRSFLVRRGNFQVYLPLSVVVPSVRRFVVVVGVVVGRRFGWLD